MSFEEMSKLAGRLHKICKRFQVAIKIGGDFIEMYSITDSDMDDIQAYMFEAGYKPYGSRQYGRNGVTINFQKVMGR